MKKKSETNNQEIIELITIRDYIATAINSNCKHITKKDINELFEKMVEVDIKAIQLIKDMKV